MAFAEQTTVPFDKSIGEIMSLIKRAGAIQTGQTDDGHNFVVAFRLGERMIRFTLPLATEYTGPKVAGNGRVLDPAKIIDQRNRQKARALRLVIQAKLESVESGIETIEQAFLANVVMSNGQTVYERIAEPIALEYVTGRPDVTTGLLPAPKDQTP